jgi:hypothetical protein
MSSSVAAWMLTGWTLVRIGSVAVDVGDRDRVVPLVDP